MISSCFSNFKEIVRFVPVSSLTGSELKNLTLNIIDYIQQFNFKVLVVLSDNNRINQNMFTTLSPTSFHKTNPTIEELPLYLSYDTVHIFKNIKNNWLNTKNYLSTFIYPDFNNPDIIRKASFDHLREFHKTEKSSIIKKAYKLNDRTLYPTNIERQNVTLTDNVFHSSTIAALKEVHEYNETVFFLELVRKWWDIGNTKNTIKGCIKRNEWSSPILSVNDPKIEFLKKFVLWLKKWRDCVI